MRARYRAKMNRARPAPVARGHALTSDSFADDTVRSLMEYCRAKEFQSSFKEFFVANCRQFTGAQGHEHNLDWTPIYDEFVEKMESHVERFLEMQDPPLSVNDFYNKLKDAQETDPTSAKFLDIFFASTEYPKFVELMRNMRERIEWKEEAELAAGQQGGNFRGDLGAGSAAAGSSGGGEGKSSAGDADGHASTSAAEGKSGGGGGGAPAMRRQQSEGKSGGVEEEDLDEVVQDEVADDGWRSRGGGGEGKSGR